MFLKKTSYTLLKKYGKKLNVRKVSNREKYWKFFKYVFIDIFPPHQMHFFENISNIFFYFFKKDVLHAFDEKRKKYCKSEEVSNSAKYWKIFQAFFYRLKIFLKRRHRLLMKNRKILQGQKVSNRAKYWKIFQVFY